MSESAPTITLVNVSKAFGSKRVLDDVSLEIIPGQRLVIMGPSGSGKTVLLKHLIGLLRPDSGQVLIDGEDLWATSEARRKRLRHRFGMAFQEGALFDTMNVFENIAFPLRKLTDLPEEEIARRVEGCLDRVHLFGAQLKRTGELSTGMRRRVGFARAIALEPRALLFDEPTAGLDPVMVTVVNRLIVELSETLQATAVMATHDLRSTREVADRVVLTSGGKLVADAPTEQFFALEHPAVRQMLEGNPEGPLVLDERGVHATLGEELR
jgi:phospholipid/cholesterol/gamma-HCH transport system ATP-binding protein